MEDESISSFFTRRFNADLANNIVSAVVSGIYAGNINRLSIKSTFPSIWDMENTHGSVMLGLLRGRAELSSEDMELEREIQQSSHELLSEMGDTSIYSFKGGLEILSKRIVAALDRAPNVTIRMETPVDLILPGDSSIAVRVFRLGIYRSLTWL
jgi:oxygen-dependent protoporphyrinogen oxidase